MSPEFTRWRLLSAPTSPDDPLELHSLLKPGKLPTGFTLLLWSETLNGLTGPMRFTEQQAADEYVSGSVYQITSYLIVPKPN